MHIDSFEKKRTTSEWSLVSVPNLVSDPKLTPICEECLIHFEGKCQWTNLKLFKRCHVKYILQLLLIDFVNYSLTGRSVRGTWLAFACSDKKENEEYKYNHLQTNVLRLQTTVSECLHMILEVFIAKHILNLLCYERDVNNKSKGELFCSLVSFEANLFCCLLVNHSCICDDWRVFSIETIYSLGNY